MSVKELEAAGRKAGKIVKRIEREVQQGKAAPDVLKELGRSHRELLEAIDAFTTAKTVSTR